MTRSARREDLRERSVVKIFTVVTKHDYYKPWSRGYPLESGGSGAIIEGRRILTNAHVVSDQVYVRVQRVGGTKPFDARVAFVDHQSELAILEVADPTFFDDSLPVRFGGLPHRQDRVSVYGFPLGGDHLSITEGIVSRVEVRPYTHSRLHLLSVQTDAAINPGNSGGPVFLGDEMVGVAFESYAGRGLENTGYFVPTPIIEHFFDDIRDGRCDGVPALGLDLQRLVNPAQNAFFGLKPRQTGIVVTSVAWGGSCDGLLFPGDVLLAVDGQAIANDGSVELRPGDRVSFDHLVTQHQIGELAKLEVLRKGRRATVKVKLLPRVSLVPDPAYDRPPSYFFFAGLVITPLSRNYMGQWEDDSVPEEFTVVSESLPRTRKRRQIVLLGHVYAHEISAGYHGITNAIIECINGRPIAELADVVKAFEKPLRGFHVIDVTQLPGAATSVKVVLDASKAEAATAELMRRYDIPRDRSPDLPAAARRKPPTAAS